MASFLPLTSEVLYGREFSGAVERDLDRIPPSIEHILRYAYCARPCSKHWGRKGDRRGLMGEADANIKSKRATKLQAEPQLSLLPSLRPEGSGPRCPSARAAPARWPGSHPRPQAADIRFHSSFPFLGSRGGVRGAAPQGEGVYDATSGARRNWSPFASAAGPEVEAAVAAAQSVGKEEGRELGSGSRSLGGGNSLRPL